MKKKDMKKKIEDGFSQLAPDVFETVIKVAEEQGMVWMQEPIAQSKKNRKMVRRPVYLLSFCTCLAMFCICMLGLFVERQHHVYMVLDINPSIQIEMNERRQVEGLKGLNQDGKDVVKELKWEKKEPVQELLDVLIQDVVEKSYLRDNEGILVTLSAPCKDVCESLERTLGEGIDRKLTELKVCGVTTAFRQTKSGSENKGRKLLETELAKCTDMNEEQVQQLSVRELIQYCQDYTTLDLKLSETSVKEKEPASGQKDTQQPEKTTASNEDEEKSSEDKKAEKKEKKDREKVAEKKENEKESGDASQQQEATKLDNEHPKDSSGAESADISDAEQKASETDLRQETSEEEKPPENIEEEDSTPRLDNPGEQESSPDYEKPGEQQIPVQNEPGKEESLPEVDLPIEQEEATKPEEVVQPQPLNPGKESENVIVQPFSIESADYRNERRIMQWSMRKR